MDDQLPWSNHKIEKKKKHQKKNNNQNKTKQNSYGPYISFSKKSDNFNIPTSYWLQLETKKSKKLS
jgi:hypothetical protein